MEDDAARVWLAHTLVVVIETAAATAAMGQKFPAVNLMSWNVEDLFDTADDQSFR